MQVRGWELYGEESIQKERGGGPNIESLTPNVFQPIKRGLCIAPAGGSIGRWGQRAMGTPQMETGIGQKGKTLYHYYQRMWLLR